MIRCTRCGIALKDPDRRTFSVHTRLYFCTAIDACAKRAKRKARKSKSDA